jgi:16S rRNA (adenine1518-N6/adenine1519-N6)-dimethyltransferase
MNIKDTNEYINLNKFNPSKKMGQNFLINDDIIKKIISTINFNNVDCVIEIGPGLGAITDQLAINSKHLLCIELDKRLAEFITKRFKDKENVEVVNEDVLKIDFNDIASKYTNVIIVSNLPYSISSLVLMKFIKSNNIKTMYCMLQKEMVDRITAKPSTHEYNGFTVIVNRYTKIERLLTIGRNNFIPAPEVESVFISITKTDSTFDEKFEKFIRLCFVSKRRTLLNNLHSIISKTDLVNILTEMNIDPQTRAEALTVEQLELIYKKISN